jgi:hypothetical protein
LRSSSVCNAFLKGFHLSISSSSAILYDGTVLPKAMSLRFLGG